MPTADTDLTPFYAKYDPAHAKLAMAVRAKLRARLPGLLELVYMYERQEAFVISYSPTEAGASGVAGLSLKPGGVTLFLNGGDALSQFDPKGLLGPKGGLARQLALHSIADYDRPEIEILIAGAVLLAKVKLVPGTPTRTIVKAAEQKKRAAGAKKKAGSAKTPARAKTPAGAKKKTAAKR